MKLLYGFFLQPWFPDENIKQFRTEENDKFIVILNRLVSSNSLYMFSANLLFAGVKIITLNTNEPVV